MTPLWLKDIEQKAGTYRVLLVEGPEDVKVFTNFLNRYPAANEWSNLFRILPAGRKDHVLIGLRSHNNWIGIVDLDEWGEERVQQEVANLPNLRPLPRFCLESYFCNPGEIWEMIPDIQKRRINNELLRLETPIFSSLPDWIRHGALWRVLHRMYRNTCFPSDLEDRPVGGPEEIRQRLEQWHSQLSPDLIMQSYHQEIETSERFSQSEYLATYIHGKKFFHEVVNLQLNRAFGQKSAEDWMDELSNSDVNLPDDLISFLNCVMEGFSQ